MRARGPGRVNLLGEHTDYNAGLCLPFAVEAGVTVVAEATESGEIEAQALAYREDDRFDAAEPPPAEGWRAFVRGTVAELSSAGIGVPGARLRIESDLPEGAGLSSSAALGSALCVALLAVAGGRSPSAVSSRGCAHASRTTGSARRPACSTRWPPSSGSRATPCCSTAAT